MKKIIIKLNESNDSNVIDLKKLCEGNFEIKDNGYIFIEESEVDYDLLSRDNIINQLYNSIINCKPHENFPKAIILIYIMKYGIINIILL